MQSLWLPLLSGCEHVLPCRPSCATVPCHSHTITASSSDCSSVLTWRHSSSCLQPYSY
jgi:hypothetical protein